MLEHSAYCECAVVELLGTSTQAGDEGHTLNEQSIPENPGKQLHVPIEVSSQTPLLEQPFGQMELGRADT